MKTKLIFLALSAFILSGCTLLPSKENAATDTQLQVSPVATSTPAPAEVDQVYVESQQTSSNNDLDSLESDLNKTLIPDEDLSDILGE